MIDVFAQVSNGYLNLSRSPNLATTACRNFGAEDEIQARRAQDIRDAFMLFNVHIIKPIVSAISPYANTLLIFNFKACAGRRYIESKDQRDLKKLQVRGQEDYYTETLQPNLLSILY